MTVSVAETALVKPVPPTNVNVSPSDIVWVAAPSPVMSKVVDPPGEVLVIVTAPVAPETEIPDPATAEVTPVSYTHLTLPTILLV